MNRDDTPNPYDFLNDEPAGAETPVPVGAPAARVTIAAPADGEPIARRMNPSPYDAPPELSWLDDEDAPVADDNPIAELLANELPADGLHTDGLHTDGLLTDGLSAEELTGPTAHEAILRAAEPENGVEETPPTLLAALEPLSPQPLSPQPLSPEPLSPNGHVSLDEEPASGLPLVASSSAGSNGGPPRKGKKKAAADPAPNVPAQDKEQDLFSHLAELRARILWSISSVAVAMLFTWNFGRTIQQWCVSPIERAYKIAHVSGKIQLIGPTDGFMLYFQIAMTSALFVAAPFVLFQMWRFLEPALTHRERRYTLVLVPFSVILFFLGAGLGYAMSPLFFQFFLAFTPPGTEANYSYSESVVLLAKMLLVFGACFQVPVLTIFLNKTGIVSRNLLIEYWRHVVVVIFTVVAIITPTWDPVTLIVCSIPPCILYVLSIWLVKWI